MLAAERFFGFVSLMGAEGPASHVAQGEPTRVGEALGSLTRPAPFSGPSIGLGNSSAGSLLGMLAPIVKGLISKQSPASGFSAGGLTDLLMSQKDHIAGALPQGLCSQLGFGELLDEGQDAISGAVSGVSNAARTATREVESARAFLVLS